MLPTITPRCRGDTRIALGERNDADDINDVIDTSDGNDSNAAIVNVVDDPAAHDTAGRRHQRRHQPQRGMGEAGAARDGGRGDIGRCTQRKGRRDLFRHLLRPYMIAARNDTSDMDIYACYLHAIDL
jgi:hypothetical protein